MSCKIEIQFEEGVKGKALGMGPWRDWDIEFLRSQKAMDKTLRGLQNLNYNFNFLLRVRRQREKTDDVMTIMQIDPEAINVVYTNNVTTEHNWLPITPWIAAHRIGHALISAPAVFDSNEFSTKDGPEALLFEGLEDLYVEAFQGPLSWDLKMATFDNRKKIAEYIRKNGQFTCMSGVDPKSVGFMATHLFTMKSARERMISNELDIFAEAFAQFLITGRFRMNRWAKSGLSELKHSSESVSHPSSQVKWGDYLYQPLEMQISPEEFDSKVAAIEVEANRRMKLLADRLVGMVVAF